MNRRRAPRGEKALSLLLDLGDPTSLTPSMQPAVVQDGEVVDYRNVVYFCLFDKSYLFGKINAATVLILEEI